MGGSGIISACCRDGIGVRFESTNLVSFSFYLRKGTKTATNSSGSTPPDTEEDDDDDEEEEHRPGMLQRTLSLTRGDRPGAGLFRRLSGRGPPPTRDFDMETGKPNHAGSSRRMSVDGALPQRASESSFFRRPSLRRKGSRKSTNTAAPGRMTPNSTGTADDNDGDEGVNSIVNLEGGLAVTLNLELNPKDPSGITMPYKLLVPVLRYDGMEYDPPATKVTKGWRKWLRVGRKDNGGLTEPGAGPENITATLADDQPGRESHEGHPDQGSPLSSYPTPPHPEAEAASESDREDDAPASEDEDDRKTTRRKKWFGL